MKTSGLKIFICGLLMSLSSLQAGAFPINRILQNAPPEYIREYWKRMDLWYQDLFAQYQSSMSPNEMKLLMTVRRQADNWGVIVNDKWTYRSFWYAHHVQGKQALHRNIFYSVNPNNPEQAKLISKVLSDHGISTDLPLTNLWGFANDFDTGIFEIQWMMKSAEIAKFSSYLGTRKAEFDSLLRALPAGTTMDPWLVHLIYRKGKLQDIGLTVPMQNAEDPSLARYLPNLKVIAWAKRIYLSGKSENLLQLVDANTFVFSDMGRYLLIKHRQQFGQLPLFMVWNSSDDYTLYYP